MVKRKAISVVIVGALALAARLRADMMPVSLPDIGSGALASILGPTESPPIELRSLPVCLNAVDRDLSPIRFLLPADSEIGRDSQTPRTYILRDDRSSFDLCLFALIGLGLCRLAPLSRKLSFSLISDCCHDDDPYPTGHGQAIGPDLRFTPALCVVQPDCRMPESLPPYDWEVTAILGRRSQCVPISHAARGPPLLF